MNKKLLFNIIILISCSFRVYSYLIRNGVCFGTLQGWFIQLVMHD